MKAFLLMAVAAALAAGGARADETYDLVIYGSTPAAISCAVQAKRMGVSAVIVSPETRIGGLTTGGLGQTDIGNKSAFGGIALEFYRAVADHYRSEANWKYQKRSDYLPDGQCSGTKGADSMWTFEPSAALKILEGWEKRDSLVIHRGKLLDRAPGKVKVEGQRSEVEGQRSEVKGQRSEDMGRRIVSFVTLDGTVYRGKMFVDATYEGDLMAAAGVTYTVGREANSVYGETISGIQRKGAVSHQFHPGVSPYVKEGDPTSGLLPCVEKDVPDPDGTGDRRVQAYCFRMCLTDVPENRIPFKKPANYRELDYELLFREFAQSQAHPEMKGHGFLDYGGTPNIMSKMPNRKTDTNNRTAFSTDFIGQNYAWPEASYAEREKILRAHLDYQQGLMWTLANHPRIPKATRDYYSRYGTCRDEFQDGLGDGWQRQLYVREARRLVGDYVVTQMDCLGKRVAKRPVALAAYGMDSHHCRRHVDKDGFVRNEGDIQDWTAGGKPYPIDYGALVPKRGDCANLLVPVCVSASHMAFGSIRMEPVFFALGQVAATAAALAISSGCDVQDLPYEPLARRLANDGQVVFTKWPVLKTYEGECLRRIKMPLGGIGTGTVSLNGTGGFVDWAVRNAPAIGFTPQVLDAATGFWLRTEEEGGRCSVRLLEGPPDTSLYEGGEGGRFPNHGFPRFRSCAFRAAYPLAQVALSDASVPVSATLEAMNPLVPGDADASGIPAALLRWKLTNRSEKRVRASVLGFLVNVAGGTVTKSSVATNALRGVTIGSADAAASDSTLGRLALLASEDAGDVAVTTRIADLGWRIRMDRFWKQFAATGKAGDLVDPDGRTDCPAAAVSVTVDLYPGETKAVPFVLSWRFPNRAGWSGRGYRDGAVKGPFDPKRAVGNWYARRFPTAVDAASALWRDLPKLEARTVAFVNGVLGTQAPDVVKEAALFNLSTLRTETCFRTADGHFFGWEGIFEDHGSCFGNCSHVWGYEHALVDLWPDLARDMTELQFDYAMDGRGHVANRIGLPLDRKNAANDLAAADGQMQCVIKAYENWKRTGDDAWLGRYWPKIRKAMEFCWVEGGWDADRDGLMEGCQHNTMDVEYYGPNPQMEFLYLAGLKAAVRMAEACGDAEFAKKCRELAARGSSLAEKTLFNGAWYEHRVVPPKGKIADGLSYGNASNLSDPDFQLAAGCLVDQLLGDYAARHVGLGPVADERNAAKTLDTILEKCASDNVGPRYNCGRDYAFPEESALKMAWYPEGRMPRKPFPYYGENMTGFEYVVAACLAQRGDWTRAEKVVRDIRNRYDGRKRNPFDEAECGHHYARALVAWTVFRTFTPLSSAHK